MTSTSTILWPEFWLRTLTLHWLTAAVVVLLIALLIKTTKRLNATTRHNLWLLTLVSCGLMPLLVFVPRPCVEVPSQSFTAAPAPDGAFVASTLSRTPAFLTTDRQIFGDVEKSEIQPEARRAAVKPTAQTPQPLLVFVIKGIFVVWLVGTLFLLRRLWGEYRAAQELDMHSDPVTPWFEQRFNSLCARLDIDKQPTLRFHPAISAPMTVGTNRVWVAIPMTWREGIDESVFNQTLTHELGHIARKDPVIHAVQRLLTAFLWMYPAVWYVSRQLEIERESACDDWVLNHDGKCSTYASNLLDVAETLYLQPRVLAVGCLDSYSQLSRRIQNLLDKKSDHRLGNSWALLALTAAGLATTLSVSAVAWPDARQLALLSAEPAEPAMRLSHAATSPSPPKPAASTAVPAAPFAPTPPSPDRPYTSPLAEAPAPVPAPNPAPVKPAKPASNASVTASATPDKNGHAFSGSAAADVEQVFRIERWPAGSNRISLAYHDVSKRAGNQSKLHKGLDFPARKGSAVRAVAAGFVEESEFTQRYGNYVLVNHGNGYKTKYANNLENLVNQGDVVTANQTIARVGDSSLSSTGPHLHFEVWLEDKRVDPQALYAKGASQ